ncbi:hypothetical protein [Nonomuraea sp. NPDC050310]|uniref:hypothetical protein n=1 Tax=Nonomuraea sp. NPDC050310 TaxID=3154935 RepID=UPI0033DBA6FD
MTALYASLIADLQPQTEAAEQLRDELATAHGITAAVHAMEDVTVVMVGERLAVWGYGNRWRWWTGQTNSHGKWLYDQAVISNPSAAARLIAARHTELIASQSEGSGRR